MVHDAETGELLKSSSRPHPEGTEVDPHKWWNALQGVIQDVGGMDDISAIGIAGQQHGMVLLDEAGLVIRPALLWNDTRSSSAASELNFEFPNIYQLTGSQLVAAFTASKVRWVRNHEPENAKKVRAIALPHDWLSWKLSKSSDIREIFSDRSDASGTGYFNGVTGSYVDELVTASLGHENVYLPRIIAPNKFGFDNGKLKISAGVGDNAAGALGVGAEVGDLVISLGSSGTAFAISATPTRDPTGEVAGFSDATGNYLPLACTLNAAKIFDSVTSLMGISFKDFSQLALQAKPGAGGLTFLPHFDGERTPNRPDLTGNLFGMTHQNFNASNLARAAIEGVIAGIAYAANRFELLGVHSTRILLIGGAARNPAVQQITADIFGKDIYIPPAREYVAEGAAKQAAWALLGSRNPPSWDGKLFKKISYAQNNSKVKEQYFNALRSL